MQMFFSVLHVPLIFIYGGDSYVQESGDLFHVFLVGEGALGNTVPRLKYKTQCSKGCTAKSQTSLPARQMTIVPLCCDLRDTWGRGIFITKTGTALSKLGQLVTLPVP